MTEVEQGLAAVAAAGKRSRRHRRRKRRGLAQSGSLQTAAGTIVADPAASPTEVAAILYGPHVFEPFKGLPTPDQVSRQGRGGVLWVDVSGLADVAAIEQIGARFGLHRLTLEDAVNLHQRPKVDFFEHYVFVVMKMLDEGDQGLTEQFSLVIGKDFLITFQEWAGDCFDAVRNRLGRAGNSLRTLGPDALAHALIDSVVDNFFPTLERYGEVIETLEDEVVSGANPSHVQQVHTIKRELLELRRSIWPTRELVNTLIREENPLVQPATKVYLRDCYDHTIQLMDIVETYREIASGLVDVYLSSMSAKLNEVMKVLTVIATIFIPLSFFAGVWGMNFQDMPELHWRYGYPLALLFMFGIAAGLVWYFRRRGWLGASLLPDDDPPPPS